MIDVLEEGADPTGNEDSSRVFQRCVDLEDGGGVVIVPPPPQSGSYRFESSVVLRTGVTVSGFTPATSTIVGAPGVIPFVTGDWPHGDPSAHREIRLQNLCIESTGCPVVQLWTAPDYRISDCAIRAWSLTDPQQGAIDAQMSFRGAVENCFVAASGGGWAMRFADNCNAQIVEKCRVTGGQRGGAVWLGQSQCTTFRNLTIEVSTVGFCIGGQGPGGGLCNSVCLDDNYLEQVNLPYDIGNYYAARGVSIRRGWITSRSLADPIFRLGRLENWIIEGSSIEQHGPIVPLVEFVHHPGEPKYARKGVISNIHRNAKGPLYSVTGFPKHPNPLNILKSTNSLP